MATDSPPIPISVRCLNTKLHAKAVFSNAGILTNLFARATGAAANAKNEKRYIKIFQSRPFRIGTRPDTEYELIYTSETFDDVSDICPSLLAYIKTFKDMDTQLRLSIYYNSSITGSKDVLLGLTNFTVADMLRSCSYNAVGTMSIDIHSEYCTGIKAYIEIIDPLPNILDELKLPVLATKHEKNPLSQTYVFFSDVDISTPLLKVVEQTWEPKFSGMVSLLFLENFLAAVRKSVVAWKLRQEQERIRQGKFMSDHEAFGYGWHVLEVTVRGARFASQEHTNNPTLTLSPQPPPGVTPTANYTLRFPLTPEFVPELDRVNPNAALLPASPQLERRSRASSSHGLGPGSGGGGGGGSFAGRGAGLVKSKSGRLTTASSTSASGGPPTGKNGAVLPTKKYDETLPSTFVQIYWEDPAKTFVEPIARTNTEYYTPFPVYGTNLHAQYARKGAHQQAVALQEKIQVSTVEKEVIYNVFEATNRCFLPKRWQTWTLTTASPSAVANRSRLSSHDDAVTATGAAASTTVARTSDSTAGGVSTSTATAAISLADDQVYVFDSQQAQHTTFKIYVANTHPHSQLRLDVMCETLQGHVKKMATCALPVADVTSFSGWLPLTMHKDHHHHHPHHHQHDVASAAAGAAGATPTAAASTATAATGGATAATTYDVGEILVDIKVHSPPPSSVPLQAASLPLDVMDEVFHLQRRTDGTIDLFSDATAIDYRYNLAQCYEWMWALGMHSQDPLMVDGGRTIASHLSRSDLEQLVDQMAAHETTPTSEPPSGATSPTVPLPPPPPPSTAASSATPSAATSPRVRRPSVSFQSATGAASGGSGGSGGVTSAASTDGAAPLTGRSLSGDNAPLPSSPAVVSTKSLPAAASDATADGSGSGSGGREASGGVTVVERSLSADDLTDLVQQALDPRKPVRRGSKLLPTLKMDDDSDDEDDDGDGDAVSAARRMSDGGRLRLEDVDRALAAAAAGPADVSVEELSHSASHGALLASLLRMDAANDGDDAGDGDAASSAATAAQSPLAAPEPPASAATTTTTTAAPTEATPPTAAAAPAATSTSTSTPAVVSLSIGGVTTTLNPTATATATAAASSTSQRSSTTHHPHRRASTTKISPKGRVDVTYQLSWISQHIRELQDIIDEVELLLAGLRQKIRADRCFRSSVFKKEAEWQMLPTNLHYQVVGVQCHRPKRRGGPIAPDTDSPVGVIHSVTSGAMTPHMLKHKKGGLLHQEQDWDSKKSEVHILKGRFLAQVREYRQLHVPRGLSTSSTTAGRLLPMDAKDGAYKTLLLLGHKVQSWESQAVEIGRRRMYAMSQSISIAVNSFLLKLNLLCQGAIEVSLAEKWLTAGFLLVFEGLLSVTGHEKSMLEDTITAVDALRNYRIRLLSKAQYVGSNTKGGSGGGGGGGGAPSLYQQNLTRQSSRYVTPAVFARQRSTSSQNSARLSSSSSVDAEAAGAPRASESGPGQAQGQAEDVEEEEDEEADLLADPDFTFQGREIRIYLSRQAIAMLPATYREAISRGDGALIALFPVLFTQGIDMQQTMANTFGSDMSAFELQYLVNNRALQWVNAYCHRVQPLDSTSNHPHTYHATRPNDIVQLPHSSGSGGGLATHEAGPVSPVAMSSTMTPPPPPPTSASYSPTSAAAAATAGKAPYHPMVSDIHQAMNSSAAQLSLKNVDLLEAVERLTVILDGVRVTFCKSGKDRTGMAVTLDQARQLSARYGLFNGLLAQSRHLSLGPGGGASSASASSSGSGSGNSSSSSNGNSNTNTFASLLDERLAQLANLMRVYGTRVAVAEKNIGRPVYSINLLQARFLPPLLRPPPSVCEAMLKKDNS